MNHAPKAVDVTWRNLKIQRAVTLQGLENPHGFIEVLDPMPVGTHLILNDVDNQDLRLKAHVSEIVVPCESNAEKTAGMIVEFEANANEVMAFFEPPQGRVLDDIENDNYAEMSVSETPSDDAENQFEAQDRDSQNAQNTESIEAIVAEPPESAQEAQRPRQTDSMLSPQISGEIQIQHAENQNQWKGEGHSQKVIVSVEAENAAQASSPKVIVENEKEPSLEKQADQLTASEEDSDAIEGRDKASHVPKDLPKSSSEKAVDESAAEENTLKTASVDEMASRGSTNETETEEGEDTSKSKRRRQRSKRRKKKK